MFSRVKVQGRRAHAIGSTPRVRVLYVEDEDINWEIAQHELDEEFALSRAASAREAFARIAEVRYDTILIDIQLCGSDIDGIQVARLLRGQDIARRPAYAAGVSARSTPIIFVTGYTARYPREELLAAGGDDMIPKPVDFAHLSSIMKRFASAGRVARH